MPTATKSASEIGSGSCQVIQQRKKLIPNSGSTFSLVMILLPIWHIFRWNTAWYLLPNIRQMTEIIWQQKLHIIKWEAGWSKSKSEQCKWYDIAIWYMCSASNKHVKAITRSHSYLTLRK